jgi:hypothetical protein
MQEARLEDDRMRPPPGSTARDRNSLTRVISFWRDQELERLAWETCSVVSSGTAPGALPAMIGLAGTGRDKG